MKKEQIYIDEQQIINHCVDLIISRLNWGPSKNWKLRDFEKLCDMIFESTQTQLSLTTIKRLFLKNESRLPHLNTLTALARFQGYNDWYDFKDYICKSGLSSKSSHIKQKNRRYNNKVISYLLISILLLVIVIIIIHLMNRMRNEHLTKDIPFTVKITAEDELPSTAIFNYDLTGINFDTAYIVTGWSYMGTIPLSKEKHSTNFLYFYPGLFKPKLVIDHKIVKEIPIFIKTKDWIAYSTYFFDTKRPTYLLNDKITNGKSLYVSPEILLKNNVSIKTSEFWVHFAKAGDFSNVKADNFSFETRIKNSLAEGGLICQSVFINLWAEGIGFAFTLGQAGCAAYFNLHVSEKFVWGMEKDNSAFSTDLSDWIKVKVIVRHNCFTVFRENDLIYSIKYKNPVGKLSCISYSFFGCGAVDYTKVYDANESLIYSAEFNK